MNKALILVILIIMVIFIWESSTKKVLELPYPQVFTQEGIKNKYFCEALLGTMIMAPAENIGKIKKGVKGEVFKGTDKISIEIRGDKLHFLTRASFEAGDAADENPWSIIYNDKHTVLAVDAIEKNLIVNVFALNKDTGIANWTKLRSADIITGNPDGQSYCLKCEPR
jgi:hypothetical protein